MKRYLKVTGNWVYAKDEITKEDLLQVKNRAIDVLIDAQEGKIFDPEKNTWVEIDG